MRETEIRIKVSAKRKLTALNLSVVYRRRGEGGGEGRGGEERKKEGKKERKEKK